jgi:hypothetical protein
MEDDWNTTAEIQVDTSKYDQIDGAISLVEVGKIISWRASPKIDLVTAAALGSKSRCGCGLTIIMVVRFARSPRWQLSLAGRM